MNHDPDDRELLEMEVGEPSATHDETILQAISQAGTAIASRRTRKTRVGWLVTTAAMAASVLLVPYFLANEADQFRDLAGNERVVPPNAAELMDVPSQLKWPSQADASGYRVVLRDINDVTVFVAETRHPISEVSLDVETVALLKAGQTYLWVVQVEGSMKNELGPYWFSLIEGDTRADQ